MGHDANCKLAVKGNLKHRLEKLGIEIPWNDLGKTQKKLRSIVWSQVWAPVLPACNPNSQHVRTPEELEALGKMEEVGEEPFDPVRPPLGGGAFFGYLTPDDSRLLPRTRMWHELCADEELLSTFIVVSSYYEEGIQEVLSVAKEGNGREHFLYTGRRG